MDLSKQAYQEETIKMLCDFYQDRKKFTQVLSFDMGIHISEHFFQKLFPISTWEWIDRYDENWPYELQVIVEGIPFYCLTKASKEDFQ